MSISYAPRAAADLESIFEYTWRKWGSEQADKYTGELRAAIENAPSERWRIIACPNVRRGLSKIRSGVHLAFVRKRAGGWVVVRILHQRQDAHRNL